MSSLSRSSSGATPNVKGGTIVSFLRLLQSGIFYAMLIAMALVAAFPFYWMFVAATRRSATLISAPPPITLGDAFLQNYNQLMESIPFWRIMLNSLFVATTFTLLALFFCSLAGYAFAKFSFPGRDKLFAIMLGTMMLPSVLGIIPSFMIMRELGWLDTYLPLLIPGAASAFGIFLLRQYVQSSVSGELVDSARIDGAHEFRIYWNIVLPIIKPGLAALAIFTFLGKWNEYFWPLLILRNEENYTVPVALASMQGTYWTEEGVRILGATLAIVPIMLVFLMASRQFIAGLTAGAIKGE